MNANKIALLAVIVFISAGMWGFTLYNGWLNEIYIFGYNIVNSLIDDNIAYITDDENVTTVKYGEYTYRLLDTVIIPDNITAIEDNAFKGNKLIEIRIGSNVSLGKNSIGFDFENIYARNNKAEGYYLRENHKSTTWTIWYNGFYYENINLNNKEGINLKGSDIQDDSIDIPDNIHGLPVISISSHAFYENHLTAVTIPNSVTSIGYAAFTGNQLTSVAIGNSVTSIGDYAFSENKLTRVVIPNSVTSISYAAFYKNQLTSVTIGGSVTHIGDFAFAENQLTGVTIPNSVTSIGTCAFITNQLTNITLGSRVAHIGEQAFRGNRLTSVFLPNSVVDIGVNAFTDNPLTRVSIGANVSLGSGDNGQTGILGHGAGFNTAYYNNSSRAAVLTRPSAQSSQWTRTAR